MPETKVVYDLETGEALKRPAITAREVVERDPVRYGWKRPTAKQQETAKAKRLADEKPADDDDAAPASSPFDHDGDGKPGGSKPKHHGRKPVKAKAKARTTAPPADDDADTDDAGSGDDGAANASAGESG